MIGSKISAGEIMAKKVHFVPAIVRFAQLTGDYAALSMMGRAGARRKREIAAKDREGEKAIVAKEIYSKRKLRPLKPFQRTADVDYKMAAANDRD
jgi:hypothetical protein